MLASAGLVMLLLTTLAHRGPVVVVDDTGIRLRDLLGWTQVPWTTLRAVTTSAGGRVLDLDAPGGVFYNDALTRRPRQRYKIDGLEVRPDHLVAYLQHRHVVATRR
ncbi:hypothetical protein DT076_09580 [Desertihabitans brevis]|uniref:Low molecular weight protein antigen 6 PH domain-containing protein n=1 Tax=Desertihabitans brevis TaxID=2268447 RepID=A0A367YV56_9ACTN|nr:PH domain-containing protein [Desertihabitans brevis]RCK69690.1 hypothetical protein DT076_09580 [Desertihabitans brevis]